MLRRRQSTRRRHAYRAPGWWSRLSGTGRFQVRWHRKQTNLDLGQRENCRREHTVVHLDILMIEFICRCGSVRHKRLLDIHFPAKSRQCPSMTVSKLSYCPWGMVKHIFFIDLQVDECTKFVLVLKLMCQPGFLISNQRPVQQRPSSYVNPDIPAYKLHKCHARVLQRSADLRQCKPHAVFSALAKADC